MDLSAIAYTAEGNQVDVAYFKKPVGCDGAIGTMGDDTTGFGYAEDKEGVFIHMHLLPPDVNFVFLMVNVREGAYTLQQTGAGIKFVDGSEPNGHFVATAPLDHPTEAVLGAVLIRGPPHMYPPSWQLQITSGVPQVRRDRPCRGRRGGLTAGCGRPPEAAGTSTSRWR